MNAVSLLAVMLALALLYVLRGSRRELAQARADLAACHTQMEAAAQRPEKPHHATPANTSEAVAHWLAEIEKRDTRIAELQMAEMQANGEVHKLHDRIEKLQITLFQRDEQLRKLKTTIKAQEHVIRDLSLELQVLQLQPQEGTTAAPQPQHGEHQDSPRQVLLGRHKIRFADGERTTSPSNATEHQRTERPA